MLESASSCLSTQSARAKLIANQMVQEADTIIVMGCSAEGFCPAPLLNKVVDWGIEDPKGKPIEKVRDQGRDREKSKNDAG